MAATDSLGNFTDNRTSISFHEDYYGPTETAVFGTWLVLIIICSVIGNIFVMVVIASVKKMRSANNRTNLFLFNLAISDLMIGIFMAPVSLYTLFQEQWHFGSFWCGVNSFLNITCVLTSIHILMYISIQKYLTVKRLSECNTIPVSRSKCVIMICLSWSWAVVFALLNTVVLGEAEYKIKTTQCGPQYPILTVKSVILSVSNVILNFVLPFIIMLIMYLRVYSVMKKTAKFRRQSTKPESKIRRSSCEKAAVNTLIIVIACFIICWLPYLFYLHFIFFSPDRNKIPAFLNPVVSIF